MKACCFKISVNVSRVKINFTFWGGLMCNCMNWIIYFCYRAGPIILNYFTQVLENQRVIYRCRVFYLLHVIIIKDVDLILNILSKGVRGKAIIEVNKSSNDLKRSESSVSSSWN